MLGKRVHLRQLQIVYVSYIMLLGAKPQTPPGLSPGPRWELRSPDPLCPPYLQSQTLITPLMPTLAQFSHITIYYYHYR